MEGTWYKITPNKETREIVLSPPAEKKTFESTPRATHCTDRAQTSTTVSGWPSPVDPLLRVCMFVRTVRIQEEWAKKRYQNFTNIMKYEVYVIRTWYIFYRPLIVDLEQGTTYLAISSLVVYNSMGCQAGTLVSQRLHGYPTNSHFDPHTIL